jgi:hypothetical protein
MQRWWSIAAVIALLIAGTPSASSAQTTGGIAGKVTDSTGGVLPGATVTLSGPAMQGTQTATTDTTGSFTIIAKGRPNSRQWGSTACSINCAQKLLSGNLKLGGSDTIKYCASIFRVQSARKRRTRSS